MKRIPQLLELVGLVDRGEEKVEGYSRGMKQRLHIARTLLHDPEVLFLDEPTMGLDPVGGREIRQVIRNLQSEQKTILLTTHYMFEADALCERVAVIDKGRIVALDTPEALKQGVRDLAVIEIEVFGVPEEILNRIRTCLLLILCLSKTWTKSRRFVFIQQKDQKPSHQFLLHWKV